MFKLYKFMLVRASVHPCIRESVQLYVSNQLSLRSVHYFFLKFCIAIEI